MKIETFQMIPVARRAAKEGEFYSLREYDTLFIRARENRLNPSDIIFERRPFTLEIPDPILPWMEKAAREIKESYGALLKSHESGCKSCILRVAEAIARNCAEAQD